jgi:signal transduction histidine kinase
VGLGAGRRARPAGASAESKGLVFEFRTAPDVPLLVLGDSARLHKVLVHLVSNAIKFTDYGAVRVQVMTESREDGEVKLRFSVSDTGMGVRPEQMEAIFEPFVQGDSSTTRRHRGMGLGLAISRQLVGSMGGEIGVESQPGAGSSFWFTAVFRVAAEICELET